MSEEMKNELVKVIKKAMDMDFIIENDELYNHLSDALLELEENDE